jgi:alkanesulfonate monooxygenase SsuD/methylene tetrahydromethanopterin reductase-like flavin-dependent oxidoreductase (luciferase family)
MARLLALASTDAEAAKVARQGAQWLLKTYVDARLLNMGDDPVQRYVDSVVVHGTPERVLDEILRLREEINLEYMIGAPLSHETFVSFTEKVLPKLL